MRLSLLVTIITEGFVLVCVLGVILIHDDFSTFDITTIYCVFVDFISRSRIT